MKRFATFVIFLALVVALAACNVRQSQQADTSDIEMTLEPMSNNIGETMLMITLTDADGNPINDATLDIKGDMTHAGMQPVLAEVTRGEDGVYRVPFEWTMGGDWFVTVDATLPDGTTLSRRFDDISISGEMSDDMEEMDHDMQEMDQED